MKKFKFVIEIDDIKHAGFQKCSELSVEIANVQYFEGGSLIPNKSPGRMTFPDVTLERGATQDKDLFTRAEILIRDNVGELKFKRNKPCNVSWGKWICPYTGKVFTKASDMDIDHIVPLSHAFKTGGATWSKEKRRRFANDEAVHLLELPPQSSPYGEDWHPTVATHAEMAEMLMTMIDDLELM